MYIVVSRDRILAKRRTLRDAKAYAQWARREIRKTRLLTDQRKRPVRISIWKHVTTILQE